MFVTQLPLERSIEAIAVARSRRVSHSRGGLRLTPLLAAADVAALAFCFFIAEVITAGITPGRPENAHFMVTFLVAASGAMTLLAVRMNYATRLPLWTETSHVCLVAALAIAFSLCIELQQQNMQIFEIFSAWLLFPLLALALRSLLRRMLNANGLWQIPTVLVGSPGDTQDTITTLTSEPSLGYSVVATLPTSAPAFGQQNLSWREILDDYGAALVILIGDPCLEIGRSRVQALVRERIPFAVMPQPAGLPVAGFAPTAFVSHDSVLISYRNNLAQPFSRGLKMAFDFAAAAIGLVLTLPVFLMIAALVKLDGGPVFFSHERLGAGGRAFGCLKFRSMRTDAHAMLQHLLLTDPAAKAEWTSTQKLMQDPRITRVGRILRATSLDELPQLINVLRLDMSLVGPRPIVTGEIHHYGEDIAYYYETRPGITGLWQVSGRTETTYERRVQLDSWYVRNWSIWHDLVILVQTVPAVLKRKGAV